MNGNIRPKWRELVFDKLKLTAKFLAGERETITKRLLEAHQEMTGKSNSEGAPQDQVGTTLLPSEMFGLHECFHLATSVVLMGAESETLRGVLNEVSRGDFAPALQGKNAMTAVTAATLYYLVTDQIELAQKAKSTDEGKKALEAFEAIHQRFDEINWMVGAPGMSALDIKALKQA
jgi:hypothetical protein